MPNPTYQSRWKGLEFRIEGGIPFREDLYDESRRTRAGAIFIGLLYISVDPLAYEKAHNSAPLLLASAALYRKIVWRGLRIREKDRVLLPHYQELRSRSSAPHPMT